MAGIRALLGLFPKTGDYESILNTLDEEYSELTSFKSSKELREYHELETQIKSDEFAKKQKEILSLRFKKTDDFQKEKNYRKLARTKDISLYYKTKESNDLSSFQEIEKSSELQKFIKLEKFVNSSEFAEAKREASQSAKQKFAKSDLAKTLNQFETQKKSSRIDSYYKFVNNKAFKDFLSAQESGTNKKVEKLQKETGDSEFRQKLASMSKTERKVSAENIKLTELKAILKSKAFKNYLKLSNSSFYNAYNELNKSDEIEAFEDLSNFISSPEFKRQKKEIETKGFKDTDEYTKYQEYLNLKNSSNIKFFQKYTASKGLKNYLNLDGSERIQEFEETEAYIKGDEFTKFKAYCLKAPKKRWMESKEYEVLQDYELKKKSEKIVWYFKNIEHKRFSWHRSWSMTFNDEFSGPKVDTKAWLTRYYWGDKMLKDSYSLSQDKHFVTDGDNLNVENGRLHIVTRKEAVKGKSWDPRFGFVSRDFAYTSGLINTAKSFQQKYGVFRAKLRINSDKDLQNAFWMVGKTIVPHIDIMKASKKLSIGHAWGDPQNVKSIRQYKNSRGRNKFTNDFFIFSLEWKPGKLVWTINGLEIASTSSGVPDEEMYIAFSAGLQSEVNGILPAHMEIDWVRCYQHDDFLNKK